MTSTTTWRTDERAAEAVTGEHDWVGAANIPLSSPEVALIDRRGGLALPQGVCVVVLEVYCATCRRSPEQAAGVPCEVSEVHRGGPSGRRRRSSAETNDD